MAQESLEYGQITIGDFAEILKKIVQYGYGKEIISLDCGSVPTRFASWRGAYRCLTISHEEHHPEECTVSALLEKAEEAKTVSFMDTKEVAIKCHQKPHYTPIRTTTPLVVMWSESKTEIGDGLFSPNTERVKKYF